jgi:hypothetical protein
VPLRQTLAELEVRLCIARDVEILLFEIWKLQDYDSTGPARSFCVPPAERTPDGVTRRGLGWLVGLMAYVCMDAACGLGFSLL